MRQFDAFDLYIKFCPQETASVSVLRVFRLFPVADAQLAQRASVRRRSRRSGFRRPRDSPPIACQSCAQEQRVTYSLCTLDTIVFFSFGTAAHKACAARNPARKPIYCRCYCKLISEHPDSMISRISEWEIMKTNPRGLSVWRKILLLAALNGSCRRNTNDVCVHRGLRPQNGALSSCIC